jgi:hypothetical protein
MDGLQLLTFPGCRSSDLSAVHVVIPAHVNGAACDHTVNLRLDQTTRGHRHNALAQEACCPV